MTARTIEIAVNGQSHRVTVERVDMASDRYRVSWDGVTRVVDARPLDETTLSLVMVEGSSASHAVRCVPTTRQGELEVHIAGVVVRTLVDTSHGRFSGAGDHGRAADGEHAVTAPMPGKVVRGARAAGRARRGPASGHRDRGDEDGERAPCAPSRASQGDLRGRRDVGRSGPRPGGDRVGRAPIRRARRWT